MSTGNISFKRITEGPWKGYIKKLDNKLKQFLRNINFERLAEGPWKCHNKKEDNKLNKSSSEIFLLRDSRRGLGKVISRKGS